MRKAPTGTKMNAKKVSPRKAMAMGLRPAYGKMAKGMMMKKRSRK